MPKKKIPKAIMQLIVGGLRVHEACGCGLLEEGGCLELYPLNDY